ncbi:hypothetical protein EDD11_001382 [Mortierella claussenii]|nr:hypothetical protein EDD11_001382 [Mortierella claussenii]
MRVKPLQIHWHDKQPIYSAHFEPGPKGRLATAGGDGNVRLWRVVKDKEKDSTHIEFLSSLNRHTAAVNVVRFSPTDGNIILWRPTETKDAASKFAESDDEECERETWRVQSMMRGSLSDIYDLAWSPDGRYIISGSIDNTARIWDVKDAKCIHVIADHHHYVQGVAWDPLGEFVATQSSDRSVHIYAFKVDKHGHISVSNLGKSTKMDLSKLRSNPPPSYSSTSTTSTLRSKDMTCKSDLAMDGTTEKDDTASKPTRSNPKSFRLYHDETLTSFFRRLSFTPDGSMLVAPAGQYRAPVHKISTQKDDDTTSASQAPELETRNTAYIYARRDFSKGPVAHLPGQKKPSVAIKCSPVLYELRQQVQRPNPGSSYGRRPASAANSADSNRVTAATALTQDTSAMLQVPSIFGLGYRSIYAVATQDSILIYDTQQSTPLALVSHIHYATFTDMAWSTDGCDLILTSSDGFCSIVSFEEGELGTVYMPTQSMMALLVSGDNAPALVQSENAAESAATIAATAGMLQKLNGLSLAEHKEQMEQREQREQQKDQKDQKAKTKQEKASLGASKKGSAKQIFSKWKVAPSSQSSAVRSSPSSSASASMLKTAAVSSKGAVKTERDGDSIMTSTNDQPAPKKRRIQPTFVSALPGSIPFTPLSSPVPASGAALASTSSSSFTSTSTGGSNNGTDEVKPKRRIIQPTFVSALPGH